MTKPTDAELLAEWDRVSHIADAGQRRLACLHAVLAKWGAPPAVAGEPVAYLHDDGCWTAAKTDVGRSLNDRLLFAGSPKVAVYTTPQPTQAQAGAVPLTCEWAHNDNDDDGFWETACGEAWRFDDGGPAENSMHFCHSCGKSLRIKGKEAGNADA